VKFGNSHVNELRLLTVSPHVVPRSISLVGEVKRQCVCLGVHSHHRCIALPRAAAHYSWSLSPAQRTYTETSSYSQVSPLININDAKLLFILPRTLNHHDGRGDGDTVRNEDRGDDNDAIELAEIVRQYTQEPIVTLSPEEIASWTEEHVRSFDGQFSIVSSHRFGANHDEKSSMKCMLYV
jgi:hypothetical protein